MDENDRRRIIILIIIIILIVIFLVLSSRRIMYRNRISSAGECIGDSDCPGNAYCDAGTCITPVAPPEPPCIEECALTLNSTTYPPGEFRELFMQSDGKVLAQTSQQLYRINPDGTLDTTFGVGGQFDMSQITSVAGVGSLPILGGIDIHDDGSIYLSFDVLGGTIPGPATGVAKIDPTDGSLDTSYGNPSYGFAWSFGTPSIIPGRWPVIVVMPDHTVIGLNDGTTYLSKVDPTGTIFDWSGTSLVPGGLNPDIEDIRLHNGMIYAAGWDVDNVLTYIVPFIFRCDQDFNIDTSYGVGGKWTFDYGPHIPPRPTDYVQTAFRGLFITDDGTAYLGGATVEFDGGTYYNQMLLKVLPDGTNTDTSFGNNGVYLASETPSWTEGGRSPIYVNQCTGEVLLTYYRRFTSPSVVDESIIDRIDGDGLLVEEIILPTPPGPFEYPENLIATPDQRLLYLQQGDDPNIRDLVCEYAALQ